MNTFEKADIFNLAKLISNCDNGKKTFRYFDKRPFEIIKNHLVCELYYLDGEPIGYYHIEQENDVYWFGILISDFHVGRGNSKIIMNRVISKSNELNIDLYLSVDKTNEIAFNVYKNNKFNIAKETESYYIMKRNKGN